MADKLNRQTADTSLRNTGISRGSPGAPSTNPDIGSAGGIWADEKAKAMAKHERGSTPSQTASPTDALAVGGGQQSTPYQLETQADAIAKQTKRGI